MDDNDTKLDHRAMYYLGVLAERGSELVAGESVFPRGCGKTHTLALSQAGYLVGVSYLSANGLEEVRYQITDEGDAAWKAYRFIR
ncbi:hypothetical protein [Microvirga pudoricolor]|uniref:hypothetical protein n=1 Tax=Microvirga pudoricolor TaxID=2778729 RepID=UPI00194F212D|nr:hypothetical protein [Microvirga pudoricolor]MBM6595060.1 hypothetical protein [Microvirga pudoricolor]